MKKSLFIITLLLCMALFALPAMAECSHESVLCDGTCTECWEQDLTPGDVHELVLCTGVCDHCGAEGLTPGHYEDPRAFIHDESLLEKQYNETEHWEYCHGCGTSNIYPDPHSAECITDGTACNWCDYVGTIENFYHPESTTHSDDTYHWDKCEACGETFGTEEHYIYCDELGEYAECSYCGHAGMPSNVDHGNSWYLWAHDEDMHWKVCDYCEEALTEPEWHVEHCYAPGTCVHCGATGLTNADPLHDSSPDFVYDDNGHWMPCNNCDTKNIEGGSHTILCSNEDRVCETCGYVGEVTDHDWEYVELESNEDVHLWVCSLCLDVLDYERHYFDCNAPGVCSLCEAECGDNAEVYHPWGSRVIDHNDTHHWYECGECGEIVDENEHYSSCDNPTVCMECEATYDGSNADHYNYEVTCDENYHYDKCTGCGEIFWQGSHYATCSNPTKCDYCGIEMEFDGGYLDHSWDYIEIRHDKDGHWDYCTNCKEDATSYSEHYALCDEPGVCDYCGEAYDGENVEHRPDFDSMEHDDEKHWAYCRECGELAYENIHRKECTSDSNECYTCGYESENLSLSHIDVSRKYDNDTHWYDCKACGTEKINVKEHTFTDGKCVCGYTKNVKLAIVKQPEDAWAYEGEKATITVEAEGNGLKYQWYYKSGSKWKKASGTEASYSLTMTEARDGRKMRCVITDAKGKTVTSDTVTLDTRFAATIVTQPKNAWAYEGEKAKISVKATGDGLTYQWYYKAPDAAEWTKASGTEKSYSLTMTEARDGREMKCVVTDKYDNVAESDVVTLDTRFAAKIVTQPKSTWAYENENAVTTVEASGDGLTYQWYYKNPGSSKFKKSSITTAECAVPMIESRDGRQMYCIVTDAYGNEAKSKTITLTMATVAEITKQPKNAWAYEGEKAKISVKATGDGLTYQWYYKAPDASEWTKASGTSASYSLTMTEARDGRQMYCFVADKYGNTVESDIVTLTTRYAVRIVTQPKSAKAFEGENAVTTIEAKGEGLTYQWYYKNPGSSKFKKSSITTAECSVPMTENRDGRKMYCIVTDEYGNEVKSKTITLSIAKTAAITTEPKSVKIAENKTAKFTVKATGDSLKYQWYYQNPGEEEWKKCSGTKATYSLKATEARDGRKLYCEITDAYGNTVTTKTVKLTVK